MSLKEILSQPDPVAAARGLIGMELITLIDGEETAVRITETEAYWAPDDLASHASGHRRTKRTAVFYAAAGTSYVYLCYGIHELFNVVTGPEGTPHAVLVRSGEPTRGIDVIRRRRGLSGTTARLSSGPGVLTKALGIDRRWNGVNLLTPRGAIRLEQTDPPPPEDAIGATARIGIDYAGEPWRSKPWRFIRRGSRYLSGPKALNEIKK